MTLLEPLLLVGWLGLTVGGAVAGGVSRGPLGALAGVALGLASGPAIVLSVTAVAWVWQRLFPPRPRCARGACCASAYRYSHWEGDGAAFVCRCDDRYVLIAPSEGAPARFVRLIDGRACPYMVRRGLRWAADPASSGPRYR